MSSMKGWIRNSIKRNQRLKNALQLIRRSFVVFKNFILTFIKVYLEICALLIFSFLPYSRNSNETQEQKYLILISEGLVVDSGWVNYDYFHFYNSFQEFLVRANANIQLIPWSLDGRYNFLAPFRFLRMITLNRPERIILSSWNPNSPYFGSPTAFFLTKIKKFLPFNNRVTVLGWDSISPNFWKTHLNLEFADEIIVLENPMKSGFLPDLKLSMRHVEIESRIPMPINPQVISSSLELPMVHDVAFFGQIGSYRDYRSHFLEALKQVECNSFLSINRVGTTTYSYSEMASVMSSSKIGVNFSSSVNGEKQLKGRVWETLLSGALLLEQENKQILEYFTPNLHFVFFDSPDALIAKVEYFLRNENERVRIAKAGQEHAHYLQSENKLFKRLLS